ncbi:hypothetical protein [Burkholderia glumae]|uniref:hypothetical protein n=1 Tax=Burkholderia glumae TaxID=337 RepID=UPI00214F9BF2|nr:hypothetical protein [Burkholderia glumae]
MRGTIAARGAAGGATAGTAYKRLYKSRPQGGTAAVPRAAGTVRPAPAPARSASWPAGSGRFRPGLRCACKQWRRHAGCGGAIRLHPQACNIAFARCKISGRRHIRRAVPAAAEARRACGAGRGGRCPGCGTKLAVASG